MLALHLLFVRRGPGLNRSFVPWRGFVLQKNTPAFAWNQAESRWVRWYLRGNKCTATQPGATKPQRGVTSRHHRKKVLGIFPYFCHLWTPLQKQPVIGGAVQMELCKPAAVWEEKPVFTAKRDGDDAAVRSSATNVIYSETVWVHLLGLGWAP